ncbi:MAG: response regulator [Chthoniobacteraceae bacterium]
MILETNRRILLVDESPAMHEDFKKFLLDSQMRNEALDDAEAGLFGETPKPKRPGAPFTVDFAFQGPEALEKVRRAIAEGQPYALAFVDVRMPPGWDGVEIIEQLWAEYPSLQIVVCTAHSDYSWETISERLGVSDNLVLLKKPFDNVELRQVAHALTKKWLVTRQADWQLSEIEEMVARRTAALESANAEITLSEERSSKAFRNSPIPQAIQTLPALRFVDVNDAFLAMTGFTREVLLGRTPLDVGLCVDDETRFLESVREGKIVRDVETQIGGGDRGLRTALVSLEPLTVGGAPHILLMAQDISDRLQLETQLRQAQKMEAVGQLAAGVAHDFNNLLTIIQGHASLHQGASGASCEALNSLAQISIAAERAADLTRKLLTFSRRNMVRPRVIDLNDAVRNLTSELSRLLGEKITLQTNLAGGVRPVFADITSIEQALVNLTLNSSDAMPEGGVITIGTTHFTLGADASARNPDAGPGDYICLSIADTGTGMDEATRRRIFEPFFTTKATNEGSGMGLATVYGIVKQHDGWVEVDSHVGEGSTFRICFPATDRVPERSEDSRPGPAAGDGGQTILVVEDDAAVRSLVVEVLQGCNYTVLEAETGDAAIERWTTCREEVDLVLTDMVMPGKASGLDVARFCLATKPDVKVIYTSGYSSQLFDSDVHLEDGVNYLPKPYFCGNLTDIVRNALDSRKGDGRPGVAV